MDAVQEIKSRDLKKYLENQGFEFKKNMTLCPFHSDSNPSLAVNIKNESWVWYCHSCEEGGSIIDFVMKQEGISKGDAINKLKEYYHIENEKPKIVKRYEYKKEDKVQYVINRYKPKDFRADRKMTGIERIPYHYDDIKKALTVWLVEGEKDADSVCKIGLIGTTFPFGKNHWQPEFSKYFKGKAVYICLDKGAEKEAERRARDLIKTVRLVKIIELPELTREGQDISDWIEMHDSKSYEELKERLKGIAEKTPAYGKKPGVFIGTLEELQETEVPEDEPLIENLVFKGSLTGIGGVKGSHKSFFVNQLALNYASGFPFLKFNTYGPGTVLLIQQEVSLNHNKLRLNRMQQAGEYKTGGRFLPITTTGNQLKFGRDDDVSQMKSWIEKFEPDLLIFDPLSSFNEAEENTSRDMSKIVNIFNQLKSEYNLGLVFTHHFSSKKNPEDPTAPQEAGGWFRGHTVLPDSADALVCLHRLPGQRENENLMLSYEDYNLVQIQLRNGKWPERFAIEFNPHTFLLGESNVWQELGKKIIPGEIEDLIDDNGGEMLRVDLIKKLKENGAGITIIKKAIREALKQGLIEKDHVPGKRGNPVIYRTRK